MGRPPAPTWSLAVTSRSRKSRGRIVGIRFLMPAPEDHSGNGAAWPLYVNLTCCAVTGPWPTSREFLAHVGFGPGSGRGPGRIALEPHRPDSDPAMRLRRSVPGTGVLKPQLDTATVAGRVGASGQRSVGRNAAGPTQEGEYPSAVRSLHQNRLAPDTERPGRGLRRSLPRWL